MTEARAPIDPEAAEAAMQDRLGALFRHTRVSVASIERDQTGMPVGLVAFVTSAPSTPEALERMGFEWMGNHEAGEALAPYFDGVPVTFKILTEQNTTASLTVVRPHPDYF